MGAYSRQMVTTLASADRLAVSVMRVAIAIIFIWIGALKFVPDEAIRASQITRGAGYSAHLTGDSERKPTGLASRTDHSFTKVLGALEITIGLLTLLHPWSRRLGLLGAGLARFVTRSFLIPTPEGWIGVLGDAQHGLPFGLPFWVAAAGSRSRTSQCGPARCW